MKAVVSPIILVTVGVAWLLNVMGVMPGINWVWTASIAAVGAAIMALEGVNRRSIVLGPFLMTASVFSILRQTGRLSIEKEVPLLLIILGLLWLVAVLLKVPMPEVYDATSDHTRK